MEGSGAPDQVRGGELLASGWGGVGRPNIELGRLSHDATEEIQLSATE